MRHTRLILPGYAERFSCIGPACEDTCCAGWAVAVDETAYRRYTSLPDGPLRALMNASLTCSDQRGRQPSPAAFATIRMLPSGDCPFLTAERLCRIQVEQGPSYLCNTCGTFPRSHHTLGGLGETTLWLSCPEAARLVLLEPHLLPPSASSRYQVVWNEKDTGHTTLRAYFWQIREFIVTLIEDRRYPLWQRLFLLGSFSRRLDALARGDLERSFPDLLDDFSRAVAGGGLCASMETIPADLPLQLEMVLRLVARRVNHVALDPRLRGVVAAFIEGVGHSPTASIRSQAVKYADAYTQFYRPFFDHHPHILENYLLNAVLRDLYPFGARIGDPEANPEPARAFAMLAIRFALIKGLMIGVAGARRRDFCASDVVRTVQAAFKHFEHNRKFLTAAYELLKARKLDDARGLTLLLRN